MKRLMYLRVSKTDEEEQDLDSQRLKLIEKYPECATAEVLQERGSAYNLEKIGNRLEFFRLIDMMFSAKKTTIDKFFRAEYDNTDPIELYVWDYHRIMRNFELNLLFGLLCDAFRVKIISFKQGFINVEENEKPIQKFSRYIFYSINAFSSEDYSWNISENVKKAVNSENGITTSKDGLKWGRKLISTTGDKVEFTPEQSKEFEVYIKKQIDFFEKNKIKQYYARIISAVRKKYNVVISKSYLTVMKQNGDNNGV